MVEVNGIYKLKKIEGLSNNNDNDYKVLAIDKDAKHETAYCENLTTGECFCFWTEFLIDPEKPEDCVCKLLKISK
ncbi:hypothetical protein IJD34_06410 [bacterium]|nr:hypothetical protein [bacterium]